MGALPKSPVTFIYWIGKTLVCAPASLRAAADRFKTKIDEVIPLSLPIIGKLLKKGEVEWDFARIKNSSKKT